MNAAPVYIYGLRERFDSRIRYIGKTDNLRRRLRAHLNDRSRCHRTNWIRGVVSRGGVVELVVLLKVPKWADWKTAERGWIDFALRSGWPLTNGTFGGDGVNATPEVREKISKAMRGRRLSPADRDRVAKQLAAIPRPSSLPTAWRQAISRGRAGLKFGPAHRRRISESKRKVTPDQEREVRRRLAAGEPQSSIARAVGVAQPTVSAIKNNRRKYTEDSCS